MAAGDITLTTPKVTTDSALKFVQAVVTSNSIEVYLAESASGVPHRVTITNSGCVGIDYSGGAFADDVPRAVTGEFTKLLGLIFKANPLNTLTTTLQTDGIITVAGSVG